MGSYGEPALPAPAGVGDSSRPGLPPGKQPDRRRQQSPEFPEEMCSTYSTELQPVTQREEDQHEEIHPRVLKETPFSRPDVYLCHSDYKYIFFDLIYPMCPHSSTLHSRNSSFSSSFECICSHNKIKSDYKLGKSLDWAEKFIRSPNSYLDYITKKKPLRTNQGQSPEQLILLLKDTFKKQTNLKKYKLYYQVKKIVDDKDNIPIMDSKHPLYPILKDKLNEHRGKKEQFALSLVLMEDGEIKYFPPVEPQYRNHKNNPNSPRKKHTVHSERILIGQLDEFIAKNGTKVRNILLYTYNSPCLHNDSCMFLLVEKTTQWNNEFGIISDVIFTNYWGLCANTFGDVTHSDISCLKDTENYNKIKFRLKSEKFKGKCEASGIYMTLSDDEVKDEEQQRDAIESALGELMTLAESSFGVTDDHLDCGFKIIDEFKFTPKVREILRNNWNKLVEGSAMSVIRKQLSLEFNIAVVKLFNKDLKLFFQNRYHLGLYHIPTDMLEEE